MRVKQADLKKEDLLEWRRKVRRQIFNEMVGKDKTGGSEINRERRVLE